MRSLIEPPGLLRSDLIHTFCPAPNKRLMRTCGVLPMVSKMELAFMFVSLSFFIECSFYGIQRFDFDCICCTCASNERLAIGHRFGDTSSYAWRTHSSMLPLG